MSRLNAFFNGVQVEYVTKKDTFVIVKPDYDMVWYTGSKQRLERLSRNTKNEIMNGAPLGSRYNQNSGKAVPATARFLDDRFVNFTCELQYWFHEMNVERARPYGGTYDNLKSDFASCFRDNVWMSNKAGTWSRLDCINQNGKEPYIQLQPMAAGGALLKVVGETAHQRQECYLIEAINPTVEFAKYNVDNHRWLFFHPTLSARYWLEYEATNHPPHPDRTTKRQEWYQEPMHFYREQMVAPIFGFISDKRSSTGFVNIIEKSRVKLLETAIPNPFVMRYGRTIKNPY